jgi:hypothetical protein
MKKSRVNWKRGGVLAIACFFAIGGIKSAMLVAALVEAPALFDEELHRRIETLVNKHVDELLEA